MGRGPSPGACCSYSRYVRQRLACGRGASRNAPIFMGSMPPSETPPPNPTLTVQPGRALPAWLLLPILPPCVQAQCILFRRYPAVLQPFKYAGYPLLLQAITLAAAAEAESQPHFLSEEVAPRLQVCMRLPAVADWVWCGGGSDWVTYAADRGSVTLAQGRGFSQPTKAKL